MNIHGEGKIYVSNLDEGIERVQYADSAKRLNSYDDIWEVLEHMDALSVRTPRSLPPLRTDLGSYEQILAAPSLHKFKSLRNDVDVVELAGETFVRKHYAAQKGLEVETQTLTMLYEAGVRVPALVYAEKDVVLLEHIHGVPFQQYFEQAEQNDLPAEELQLAVEALVAWLNVYYDATDGKLRDDINLRNFLYADGVCYGVDFEEPLRPGRRERDMGRMIAFVLAYNPPFTPYKKRLARMLYVSFAMCRADRERMDRAYESELYAMRTRRGMAFEDTDFMK